MSLWMVAGKTFKRRKRSTRDQNPSGTYVMKCRQEATGGLPKRTRFWLRVMTRDVQLVRGHETFLLIYPDSCNAPALLESPWRQWTALGPKNKS